MYPEAVVEALEETEGNGRHLYLYLDALWEKDREGSRDFQGMNFSFHHTLGNVGSIRRVKTITMPFLLFMC